MKNPVLYFTPRTWAKLIYLRDIGETEIGGFGITSTKNKFLINEFSLVKQESSSVTCYFDDDGVGQHFDKHDDKGLEPWQYGRIWIHTHPGVSPNPSMTDEKTFKKWFDGTDYSIMFILARGGECYCRLKVSNGSLAVEQEIEVLIDYSLEFGGTDRKTWKEEYKELVSVQQMNIGFDHTTWLDELNTPSRSGYRLDAPEDPTSLDLQTEFDNLYNSKNDGDDEFDEDMCWFDGQRIMYEDFYLGETFEFDPDLNEFTFESDGKDYIYTGEELLWMCEIRKRYGTHVQRDVCDDVPQEDSGDLDTTSGDETSIDDSDSESVIEIA